MSGISNGEGAASVRGKLNIVLTRDPQNVAALVANTTLTYSSGQPGSVTVGDTVKTRTEGFCYQVVASGATDFDIQTAGGVRLIALPNAEGVYNFLSVNPAANGTTDDHPKLQRLIDRVNFGTGTTRIGPRVYFPRGTYFMGSPIELKKVVYLLGDLDGYPTGLTSTLLFPPNTHGIIINRFNTRSDQPIESVPSGAADFSTIKGLQLVSQGGTDRTKHGIWMRARAAVICSKVFGFPGNGGHIVAGTDRTDQGFGNANLWYLDRVAFDRNRNCGLFVDGIDANAGMAIFCDFTLNGRHGCYDSSFLGNTYIQCHAASNGLRNKGGNASDQSAVVSFGGQRYCAHWTASEAALVETTPGTNSNVWFPYGSGGESDNYPLWEAGKPVGTYFRAFGYFSDSLVASNVYFNCYNELDAPSVLLGPAIHYGSMMEGLITGSVVRGNANGEVEINRLKSTNGPLAVSMTDGTGWLTFASNSTGAWRIQEDAGRVLFRNGNQTSRLAHFYTSGTDPVPWAFGVERIAFGSPTANRVIQFGLAPPTTGTWRRGDTIINSQPSAGSWDRWRCVADGTPGVWKGAGAIEP